jgi:ribonuclease HI
VYGYGIRQKLIFSIGKYTIVFQAEMYAIKACAVQNVDRDYTNKHIYILSDSQAVIETLGNYQINSKLKMAKDNRFQLIWMPGHDSIEGNKIAD